MQPRGDGSGLEDSLKKLCTPAGVLTTLMNVVKDRFGPLGWNVYGDRWYSSVDIADVLYEEYFKSTYTGTLSSGQVPNVVLSSAPKRMQRSSSYSVVRVPSNGMGLVL